uniref:DUF569 domain-containing protein n=1 Tax=Setaria italica TaxID=4555 RepID=K3Y2H7_SETIT
MHHRWNSFSSICIPIRSFSYHCNRKNLGGYGIIGLFRRRGEPSVEPLQAIRYVRMNDHGHFNQHGWATFQLYGRSLYLLISGVVYHLDEPVFNGDEGNFGITLTGIYGRRTPLVIDLPRSEEPMDIFVLTTGSPGENFAVFLSNLFSTCYLFLYS